MKLVGKWFDFYTDDGKKYSTCYKDRADLVNLDVKMTYDVVYDRKFKEWRIMRPTAL